MTKYATLSSNIFSINWSWNRVMNQFMSPMIPRFDNDLYNILLFVIIYITYYVDWYIIKLALDIKIEFQHIVVKYHLFPFGGFLVLHYEVKEFYRIALSPLSNRFFPGIYHHLVGNLFCHLCTHDERCYWQLALGSTLIIISLSI